MRTNMSLDDTLVAAAFKYTKARTEKELIDTALVEMIESHRRLDLLDLAGKIKFAPGYDHKILRSG